MKHQISIGEIVAVAMRALLILACTWYAVLPCAAADLPIKVTYTLNKSQRVSLNIYDAKGQVVRELLHGAARMAGVNSETWDGRNDAGIPVPAGKYSWKMLSVPGFGADYIASPGSSYSFNANGAYIEVAPGSHAGSEAVAVDAGGAYIAGGTENIETMLLKQSQDGRSRIWSQPIVRPWDSPTALSVVGNTIWALSGNNGIADRFDKNTGTFDSTLSFGVVYQDEKPTDLTADTSHVITCYPKAGKVRWLDHKGVENRIASVPGASAVDVAPDGTVYAVNSTAVFKIQKDATTAAPFATNITAGARAAINPRNGDLYVCELGASQQIKRYSSAGKLVKTYGVAGGRKDGFYQNQKGRFRSIQDIAVGENGDFWIVEATAPRRVARFKADGTWVAEWYGGQSWAPVIMPEPDNPRYLWLHSEWGEFIRCIVDYEKRTWSVHSTYRYQDMAGGLIQGHYNGSVWEARVANGNLYLCRVSGAHQILKVDRTRWKLLPVVATAPDIYPTQIYVPQWMRDLAGPNRAAIWTDANGDGTPLNADGTAQIKEIKFSHAPLPISNVTLDNNLGYIGLTANNKKISRHPKTGFNSVGAPLYEKWPNVETLADAPPRLINPNDSRWESHVAMDAKGNIWGGFNSGITGWGNSTETFVAKWSPGGNASQAGTLNWQAGHPGHAPGKMRTLRRIYGVVNECSVIGAFSYEWPQEGPSPVYVWDRDGLYAGQILGRPVNNKVPNYFYSLGGEGLSGTILKHANGDVYLYGHWINEGRIYKITGWDGWQRARGTLTVPDGYTAPAFIPKVTGPAANGTGLKAEYWNNTNYTGAPVVVRTDAKLDFVLNQNHSPVGSPVEGQAWWSGRWTGSIVPRRTGWHMFHQGNGHGSWNAVWVNGTNVAQSFGYGAARDLNHSGAGRALWLTAGVPYSVRVDYTTGIPVASHGVSLLWSEPETNAGFAPIPTSQLRPTVPRAR